eukprot:3057112-Alexandrium_andersonii.AAC.1
MLHARETLGREGLATQGLDLAQHAPAAQSIAEGSEPPLAISGSVVPREVVVARGTARDARVFAAPAP